MISAQHFYWSVYCLIKVCNLFDYRYLSDRSWFKIYFIEVVNLSLLLNNQDV